MARPGRRSWKDGLLARIELEALDRTALTRLLQSALGGQVEPLPNRRIWQISGGAPLFVREALQAAHADAALVQRHDVWHWDGALRATDRLNELVEAHLLTVDPRCRPSSSNRSRAVSRSRSGSPIDSSSSSCLEVTQRARLIETDQSGDEPCLRLSHAL